MNFRCNSAPDVHGILHLDARPGILGVDKCPRSATKGRSRLRNASLDKASSWILRYSLDSGSSSSSAAGGKPEYGSGGQDELDGQLGSGEWWVIMTGESEGRYLGDGGWIVQRRWR